MKYFDECIQENSLQYTKGHKIVRSYTDNNEVPSDTV